jgi:membrane dipeptidase
MILIGGLVIVFLFSCQREPKAGDEELLNQALELHQKIFTVDTHCDTPGNMLRSNWDIGQHHTPGQRGSGQVDLPRMREGGLDAEFFAVFTAQGPLTDEGYRRARQRAEQLLQAIYQMGERYPEIIGIATSPEKALELVAQGKLVAFIGMENGYPIGRDLSMVEKYYQRGVRYITLCHSGDNDICDSSTDRNNPEDKGLSEFGRQVVAECNRLGIMIDVSHTSDQTIKDVLGISQAPVIATHSSVRALCNHPRNLSDELIKGIAAKGGVIQICLVSSFIKEVPPNPDRDKAVAELRKKYGRWNEIKDKAIREKLREEYRKIQEKYPSPRATVKDLVDHIDYVVKLVGVDYVGIGTDFDGGGGIEGCNDVTQLPNITVELLRRGYTEEDIAKIWGGNLLRVFRRVQEVARQIQAMDS